MLGGVAAFMSIWVVAMITDSCGPASAGEVCTVSPRGNTALLFVPWLAVGALGAGSLATAVLAVRRSWSPLFGLPVGLAAAYLVFKAGIWVCLRL